MQGTFYSQGGEFAEDRIGNRQGLTGQANAESIGLQQADGSIFSDRFGKQFHRIKAGLLLKYFPVYPGDFPQIQHGRLTGNLDG